MGHAGDNKRCYMFQNSNLKGTDVATRSGVATGNDCCQLCKADSRCNVFVYCGVTAGCRNANINRIPFGDCALKYQAGLISTSTPDAWAVGANVEFFSGMVL